MTANKEVREVSDAHETPVDASTEFLAVHIPRLQKSLLMVLSELESFSERIREESSHDLGSGGTGVQGDDASGVRQKKRRRELTQREKALQNLPKPFIMEQRLVTLMERDVRKFERQARRAARKSGPGSAYLLAEMYKKIRTLHTIIADLALAAADVVERMYIRVFIDRQSVV